MPSALVIGVFLVALVVAQLGVFQELEYNLYDWFFQMRGERSFEASEVVVVAIDQQTSEGLSFPFDRKYYAELALRMKRHGAKAVVFDIDFSSVSNPASDSVFYAAIASAGKVILSGNVRLTYKRGFKDAIRDPVPPSVKIAPEGTPWGIVNEMVDPDEVTRRYPLFIQVGEVAYLSLGLKTYAVLKGYRDEVPKFSRHGDFSYGDLRIPRFEYNTCLMNYYGPSGTFPTYSFIDVVVHDKYEFDDFLEGLSEEERAALAASGMADMFNESPFKDKIVLVGASDEFLQDNKFTPFFSAGDPRKTPGVEVHANALQMFFDGEYLKPVGFLWIVLGTLLLSLAMFLVARWKRQWLGIVGAVAVLFLILLAGVGLFVSKGLWLQQMPLMLAVVAGYPVNLVYRFIETQRKAAEIRGMFSQYVPKSVVDELIANPDLLKLGGERRRMSVLFCDIAGFTTFSEHLPPEELIALLNEYLTEMSQVIADHRGIIDKYEGDLVMAEFGAPLWYEDHAVACCRAALKMQIKLAEMREQWRAEGKVELFSRIGINTGEMIAGNMGSRQLFDYTVMGDAVNLASRLEGANKNYFTNIMIGQETWKDVEKQFVTRPLDFLRVKGKTAPVEVYELVAEASDRVTPQKYQVLELFSQGFEKYRRREFDAAREIFEQALKLGPDDGPARIYAQRCELYIADPPGENWDGVWTLTEK